MPTLLLKKTEPVLENVDCQGSQPQRHNNHGGRLHPPLLEPTNFDQVPYNLKCQLHLMESLHALMQKHAVEKVHNQTSVTYFNRLFLVLKLNNKWSPLLDLSSMNKFQKSEKFKMETPESIKTSLQTGEWVTSIDFKDAYFHIQIHPQSRKYLRFHVQSTAIWSVHCNNGIHTGCQGNQTNGSEQGYKNPPVPRRLVW